MKKKLNDLHVLLGYASKHKGLTFLGLGLSAVAMVLGMLPYICIWLVAWDLIPWLPIGRRQQGSPGMVGWPSPMRWRALWSISVP